MGSVVGRSFPIWLRNLVPFTVLSLIVYIPLIAYAFMTFGTGSVTEAAAKRYDLVSLVVGHALNFVVTGAVVYGVFQQIRGQPAGLGDCMRVGLTRLLPVLGVGIVVGVLWVLGTICLIIPGILVQLTYCVAVPVAVIERLGVGTSMKRSAQLTSGQKGTIFLIFLVLGLIQFAFIFGAGILVLLAGPFTDDATAGAVVGLVAAILFGALQAVGSAVAYHDLRVTKEGVGIEDLVRVFA